MPTYKITLSYDGTDFVGWQRQASGASIQGLLEAALAELDGGAVTVIGAGRTDAGVHALGQVAGFTLTRAIDADAVVRALNARLPEEVRVVAADQVPAQFHARFGARGKRYRYRIWNADVMPPFERRYAWHVAGTLDVEAMAAAATLLEGRHDFAAFQAAGSSTRTTERTVSRSHVGRAVGFQTRETDPTHRTHTTYQTDETHPTIVYDITGDGFLRYMVRNIVGSLVEIGRGHRSAEWLREVLASRDRARAGPTAPPEGLFLVAVDYGDL